MKSALAKPLHRVCGRTMMDHVLAYLEPLGPEVTAVVVGVGRDMVEAALAGREVAVAVQEEQLGTGHAVMAAHEVLAGFEGDLLVTYADIPLVRPETLQVLLDEHHATGAAATVLTALYDDPSGYGRIVRDEGGMVKGIVEHRDASPEVLAIREINAGIYCFKAPRVFEVLAELRPDNVQGEYYLTDVITKLIAAGEPVAAVVAEDAAEVMGINDRVQLAQAETKARQRVREALMRSGVTMIDPAATYVDAGVEIGQDTVLWPGVVITGDTTVGANCTIGPQVQLEDVTIGEGCTIRHASVVAGSTVGSGVAIGPGAFVRPGCTLEDDVRIGAHAETNRATIGQGSKIMHFSYTGDATVGAGCNIGAGMVTCNYDGRQKHRTVIGDGAFIGSDAILVAPVTVAPGGYVAAGSVITKDVPAGALAIERAPQRNIEGWVERKRSSE